MNKRNSITVHGKIIGIKAHLLYSAYLLDKFEGRIGASHVEADELRPLERHEIPGEFLEQLSTHNTGHATRQSVAIFVSGNSR
jgi:hypothetical protein